MALDFSDCQFQGPALPEAFVKLDLEKELLRLKLLPKTTGSEGKELAEHWAVYRRKLRELGASGGALRVRNHVIEPLMPLLRYTQVEAATNVQTREDQENGGSLLTTEDGKSRLRVWTTSFDEDLFAPSKRGRAYRYSHLRVAQRVLLASGERIGLLTNGIHLLVLISDPARPDSTVTIPIDPGWKRSRDVADSFRLLLALASPSGVAALPDLVDKARLQQARVTKDLRAQARQAVERFIQEILDQPSNQEWFKAQTDHEALARALWREGLVTVYRLLFILKLEASDDVARSFSFASTSLWRNTFSPSMALAGYAHDVLDHGQETGTLLESGLRTLFRMFEEGIECTELVVKPLGGALFGAGATPTLTKLAWGERAVAWLLDRLLWTTRRRGEETRQRVHYGPLDVEDLGRVYEALLELEPGISGEEMCRLRRQKLEVVVPLVQGEKYRPVDEEAAAEATDDQEESAEEESDDEEQPTRGKKTKVEWIEAIPPGKFYLRVGLGRKASGSYYTPHSFVRFLVQETLGPQVAERSPPDDPQPLKILGLKVLDPAMGSGHFLVEACRFLGDKLYEACRLCDERALAAERRAEKANKADREKALEEATRLRQRILDIPDPDDELVKYLPSRSPEGEQSGFSQQRAEALCRRLIATHCLYGVDKNPLAVELAKLALWLESHAEGMPLTFMDHRLVIGDSLTGPFWDKLIFRPGNPGEPIENLFNQGLNLKLSKALHEAIRYVKRLEATVGIRFAEMREKEAVKADLDRALLPFRVAAAAWSGGVMLGPEHCDDGAYASLLQSIGETGEIPDRIESSHLRKMIARGLGLDEVPPERDGLYTQLRSDQCAPALPYDLTFPEVFYPTGVPHGRQGFNALLGNPPWNKANLEMPEFMASFDFRFLELSGPERDRLAEEYADTEPWKSWETAARVEDETELIVRVIHPNSHTDSAGFGSGHSDIFAPFVDGMTGWLRRGGRFGMVLPSALHVSKSLARLRRKLLHDVRLESYFCFENKRELFEIHNSWKFTPVVATNEPVTGPHRIPAQFYLHDDTWLFSEKREPQDFPYDLAVIEAMDPETLIFQEFTSPASAEAASRMFSQSISWRDFGSMFNWDIRRELNATDDYWRVREDQHPRSFGSTIPKALVHHKPGSIHQYTDLWPGTETSTVPIENLRDRPRILDVARFFRAAYRMTARATDQRTGIYAILPPGTTATNTVPIEGTPQRRPNSLALAAVAVCNSYSFDWCLRLKVGSKTVSKFIMETTRIPVACNKSLVCVHGAIRLSANHSDFGSLWREQLGDNWREPTKEPFTWPVLAGDDERWAVRATIDAVVANAYGLSRDQYAHVLSTFSHASYRQAPELCLARFDELKQIGLEAFTKKHDPYWDIPLNENLPQPAIDLPIPAGDGGPSLYEGQNSEKKRRGRKKKA